MRPLGDAGKNGWAVADFSVMMVAIDLGSQRIGEDRLIVRSAVTALDSSLSTNRRAIRTLVSTITNHRQLIERNLCLYRQLHHLILTPAYCRDRLQWCSVRSGCNQAEWGRIVFSDECRFQLCPDDNRRCVWRSSGQLADPAFTVTRNRRPSRFYGMGCHFF
ncbi:HTH_Tnp_Tc3_2 domain-containing protein [Trichonephila clavipes]|nr:HTH_Tnp_Tc3_2 domain-containing protein [Trichonephila clavipes]